MHMADALISPAVGGAGWAATLGIAALSARHLRRESDEMNIPLTAVGAAFVFAAQMVNFAIPGTGSSGHIGGGLLLTALLGPHAAFLALMSILTVQALFFADGGLLALGCNAFNLGFFPCFIAYPLLFRPTIGSPPSSRIRMFTASIAAAVVGLQLGAFSVVLETTFSGIFALPFYTFLLFMQPIHLAIGIAEGAATAAVLLFVVRAGPNSLHMSSGKKTVSVRLAVGFLAAALVVGTVLSRFASEKPDGLEWSIEKVTKSPESASPNTTIHSLFATVQNAAAFLPDYTSPSGDRTLPEERDAAAADASPGGTSLAGAVGAALTLLFAGLVGMALKRRLSFKNRQPARSPSSEELIGGQSNPG